MSKRTSRTLLVILGVLVSLLASPPPSSVASSHLYFAGFAGGSQVTALGTTISSDLTGRSEVTGFVLPEHDTNRIAGATVAKTLVKLGAINTWAHATKYGEGAKVVTGGRTADVSLLNGLITADAVETNAVATKTPDGMTSKAATTYLGLTIAGKHYPATVKQNMAISIPGIATVVLNGKMVTKHKGTIIVRGFGAYVTLLKPQGKAPAGATILLNPTMSAAAPQKPGKGPQLGGFGFGTYVNADADPVAKAEVGRTAALAMPLTGTGGVVWRNTTASVKVTGVLDVSAITTETAGTSIDGVGKVWMTNRIGEVNAFNGLIKAEALKVRAAARLRADGTVRKRQWTKFVHLTIAGKVIPIDVSRNTKINVANLGTVTINKQVRTRYATGVIGVEVVLSRERNGLPVGAIIQLAAASAIVIPTR